MTDLRSQLTAQADYLEHGGDHTGIPATVETDSDVWRESIRLLRAAADELDHALQAEARAQDEGSTRRAWMPIETAPKDYATDILVYDASWCGGPPRVYVTHWIGRKWHKGQGEFSGVSKPTHWMPLPAPPTAEFDRDAAALPARPEPEFNQGPGAQPDTVDALYDRVMRHAIKPRTYDRLQMDAQYTYCLVCQQPFYATKPTPGWVCPLCRQKDAKKTEAPRAQ